MKIATFNVNSVKARLPRVLEWLKEAAPDVALLQEIKTSTRPSRRSRSRIWATISRPTARRPTTASRSSRNARSRTSCAACPATTGRAGALYRGDHRRFARRLDLPAQRQPGRFREISLQAGLDGPADRACPRQSAARRTALRAGRRLQLSSRPTWTSTTRRPGSTTRCSARKPAPGSAPSCIWA